MSEQNLSLENEAQAEYERYSIEVHAHSDVPWIELTDERRAMWRHIVQWNKRAHERRCNYCGQDKGNGYGARR